MPFLRAVSPRERDKVEEEATVERELPAPPISPILELARTAAAGDAQATSRLLKELLPRMVRTVHAVMSSSHPDVDDVVQQALIALIQALPAFRGECSPAHYASRIAVRTAVAARRRSRARQARNDASVDTEALAGGGGPGEQAAAERRRRLVRELLDELPEEQGEAMALRIALGWSLPEVAQATGAPLNTVRSRLRLAKEALRKRIEADPSLADELEVER